MREINASKGGNVVSTLEGLRIVELGRGMAGAMARMFLAENGATVVKVEPPGGVPYRHEPSVLGWDRGKESVVLDLKTDSGRSDLHDLLGWADGVVEDFRPGVAERLGLAWADVERAHPHLVYVTIT